jgi:pimeloyl-ACP methyl ester carboxylesterase
MLAHYSQRPLPLGPDYNQQSYAVLARKPTGKAVVFIHGYNGDALTTWAQFHKILPETPEFVGCDFFFYGHDGLSGTTTASATVFCQFLHRLFTATLSITNPILSNASARPNGFTYSKVILAAHSLGAVICRWALLFARRKQLAGDKQHDWMDKTAMVLYAPAHMGAGVSELILELGIGSGPWSTILRYLGLGVKYVSPLIDELRVDSSGSLSPDLQRLHDETTGALAQGNSDYLIAKQVVIAGRDRVVKNRQFAQDPWPPHAFPNANHSSVCKPTKTPDFLDPIDMLSRFL